MIYKWEQIESIFAYKEDRVTTDEAFLNLFTKSGVLIYIAESFPGWSLFQQKLLGQFPSIPVDWETTIAQLPFQANFTLLFDRQQRTIEQAASNYYSQ